MNPIILYEMQDYFLDISDPEGLRCSKDSKRIPSFVRKPSLDAFLADSLSESDELFRNLKQLRGTSSRDWIAQRVDGSVILARPSAWWSLNRQKHREALNVRLREARYEFKLAMRDSLISCLTVEGASLEDYLSAFTQYTFFDDFSFWVFNTKTSVFTFVSGSTRPSSTYIEFSEGSSLNEVLKENYDFESRAPYESDQYNTASAGSHSLVRIKLNLSQVNAIGVLSFYSSREKFDFQASTRENLRNVLSLKYAESLIQVDDAMSRVNDFVLSDTENYNLVQFLEGLTRTAIAHLGFEACSVFVHDDEHKELYLVASSDLQRSGPIEDEIVYPDAVPSLTGSAFASKDKIRVVYDLAKQPMNSHIFDEKTELAGSNWIGVTLYNGEKKFGILRLKNRCSIDSNGDRQPMSPTPSDYINVSILQSLVSSHITNVIKFNQLDTVYERLENFVRVFRHEVKAPVSTLAIMPENISGLLTRADDSKEKILKTLEDMKVVVHRLDFLTRVYRTEDLTKSINLEKVSLLGEVVYPMINLTGPYYRTNFDIVLNVDHDSFRGVEVWADRIMLNTVLNALLDNAAKYVRDGGVRRIDVSFVSREPDKDGLVELVVSNDGIEILEDEKDLIFNNWHRGEKAKAEHIDGTGVGLWLAREYMLAQDGRIELTSRYDPVAFSVFIQANER